MNMIKKKIIILFCSMMMCTSVAFAFDGMDAQDRVLKMYPDAMIMDVQYVNVNDETGILVMFHSQKIAISKIIFSEETGEILEQDVNYR